MALSPNGPPATGIILRLARASLTLAAREQLQDAPLDAERVKKHMREHKEHARSELVDERKRKYNSMATAETTAEEMEAYHRTKHRADDPMANMAEAATDDEAD